MVSLMFIIFLTACGGVKNNTPVEAAKTLMKGLKEVDRELINEINRAGDYWPIEYLLDVTRPLNIKDVDKMSDFDFEQDEEDENIVTVRFEDKEKQQHFLKLLMSDEKDGYFFVDIKDYGTIK